MNETCGRCGGVHEPAGKALYLAVRDRQAGEKLPAFVFRGTGKGFAVAPARV